VNVPIGNPAFQKRLVSALEANPDFTRQTRFYDGRVLLEMADGQCYLKIYCGRVIDVSPAVPVLGYTVKVTGSREAWNAYVAGERSIEDLTTPGRRDFGDGRPIELADQYEPPAIWIEGDGMEAMRMFEGLLVLIETVRDLIGDQA
jgi:hypothetical protein